jgi:hypothetical protein
MNPNLFRVALDQLQPSDWSAFEVLCSQFLLSELGGLRTTAHPKGDGGRDSELFSPEGKPFVVAQYSVTSAWKVKIRQTAKRLSAELPSARVLVFMSNQQIGGQSDDVRQELLLDGFHLDVRDRNWFLERASTDAIREAAAKELIDRIARPFLASEQVIERPASALTSSEARAALVYLGLQSEDDTAEKGLTKLCFDALVRAALRHTHSDARLSRAAVHASVRKTLPAADPAIVATQTDSALNRLSKRYIRHWQKDDEFCLTHDEYSRILSRVADTATEDTNFRQVVQHHAELCLAEVKDAAQQDLDDISLRVPRVLEHLLLCRGEEFVTATQTGNLNRVGVGQLADLILRDIDAHRPSTTILQHYPKIVATTIHSLLDEGGDITRQYLRRLSNSYTLLTFLNHVPDVQSATKKLFAHGTVWVDTTVLLPLLAERIDEDESNWRFSQAITVCGRAGVEWRVTTGVIQEINAHMNNALTCSQYQAGNWRGRVPYLFHKWVRAGRSAGDFRRWLSLFRGSERPEDDIAQFLHDMLSIRREDLTDQALKVGDELRWAADRLWTAAHRERRRNPQQQDEATTRILIQHDLETYLGVVSLRKSEQVTELGYRHWLLTLDRLAWEIRDRLKDEFAKNTPPSPLMSLSYLLGTIAFGGLRSAAGKLVEPGIPLILDIELAESMPHDLLQLADSVRRENEKLPEYVIRRKVRDAIDKARRRRGCFLQNPVFENEEAEQSLRQYGLPPPTQD